METDGHPNHKLVIFEENPRCMGASQFTIHDSVKAELETAYQKIRETLGEEDGIENAGNYVEKIDQDGESDFSDDESDSSDDIIEKFSQVPMRALTRVYPGGNQDIVIAELNPKLNTDPEYLKESESEDSGPLDYIAPVADEGAYTDAFVEACVEDWNNNNFPKNGNHQRYQRKVLIQLNKMGSTVDFTNIDTYTYQSDVPDVYNDIYFTNVYKFATHGGGDLNAFGSIREHSVKHFINEIERVDPNLVIGAFGGGITSGLLEKISADPLTEGPENLSDVNVGVMHNEIYRVSKWDGAILVTAAHPSNPGIYDPPLDALTDSRVASVV